MQRIEPPSLFLQNNASTTKLPRQQFISQMQQGLKITGVTSIIEKRKSTERQTF